MPTQVRWQDANQRILILSFEGHFTLQDLRDARRIESKMTANVKHPFHLLYDFEAVTKLFNMPHGLIEYFKEQRQLSPYIDQVVVVIPKWAKSFARFVIQIGKVLNPQPTSQIHLIHNKQEAIDFLDSINTKEHD